MRALGKTTGALFATLVVVGILLGFSTQALAAEVGNHWFQASGPLTPGAKQVSAIDTVGDTDWYYFYTSAQGEVKIGINWVSGSSTALALYRWDGGALVHCGDTDNAAIGGQHSSGLLTQSLPAGLYYVQLSGYSSGSVGGYDFTVSGLYMTATCPTGVQAHPTAVPVAEDLSTGWWNAAGPLEPIKPHVSAIDTVGDTDWYYFYTSAQGEVKIGINWVSGSSTALALYRWDGGALVHCGDTDNAAIGGQHSSGLLTQSLPAGLYYVQLSGYSSGSVGGYDFTVSGLYMTATCPTGVQAHPTAVPVAEDLSTGWWNAAGPLEPIKPHVSAIDTVGDTDWYYFYTSAQGEVKIGINWVSGSSTALALYRWDGGALVHCGDTDNAAIGGQHSSGLLTQSLPAGLYYVQLSGYSSGSVGGYDFTVSGKRVTVASRPSMTFKLAGLRHGAVKRGKSVTAKGAVAPTGPPGSKVTLTAQLKKGKKWVKAKTGSATITSTGAYSWKYKPAKKGAYRMQAVIAKTATHAAAKTAWRAFKVK